MQSIIFDMDGTLFQTDTILELALDDVFEKLRAMNEWTGATPLEAYRNIMGAPLPKVWETLLPEHSMEVREQTDAYFLERLIENIKMGKGALYPNVKETFEYLTANDYSIYIASNGLTAYLQAIVEHYQLNRWVTETFSIQQIETLDKGDLVRLIKEKYAIENCSVVGDRLSDIKAAKDNGFLAIGCNFDFAQEEELAHADVVINNLIELKTVLIAQ